MVRILRGEMEKRDKAGEGKSRIITMDEGQT